MAKRKEQQRYITLEQGQLQGAGEWDLAHLPTIQRQLSHVSLNKNQGATQQLDGHAITKLDTAGAWVLCQWRSRLATQGITLEFTQFTSKAQKLLAIVAKIHPSLAEVPKATKPNALAVFGRLACEQFHEFIAFLSFTGQLGYEFVRSLLRPHHWRWPALANVIDKTGYQALPIIALLSFMIGVVITYQMGNQLRNYGANIFIVDLLGLSVLREFGPLITSIMVAGRTGSAFTAQLGTMKVNDEIDALDTMGVTPAELLLLPRILGLCVTLPLLIVWADIFGVVGGMLMANNMLGVTWVDFLRRFQAEIPVRSLLIGLGKAPVFALLIASIGCFEGMQVAGSADSVGKKTTRSVVLAIFFIIVADAIFSVIFSKLGL